MRLFIAPCGMIILIIAMWCVYSSVRCDIIFKSCVHMFEIKDKNNCEVSADVRDITQFQIS